MNFLEMHYVYAYDAYEESLSPDEEMSTLYHQIEGLCFGIEYTKSDITISE